jgi:hypothetical protein
VSKKRKPRRKLITFLAMSVALTIASLCSLWCHAAQVVPGVQMGATTVSIFSLPQAAAAPFRQTVLTWENPVGASNRVSWGGSRYQWTNSVSVATNRFNVTNGMCYAVTSILNGVESIPALWPSNRIGELWLKGMGTNFTGGTNIVRLNRFTNTPPGNMQLWGVANITTGWE